MMEQGTITNRTTVPIGLLLTLVPVIVGGILWLTTVYAEVKANGHQIDDLKYSKRKIYDLLRIIDERTSRIEGKLEASIGEK